MQRTSTSYSMPAFAGAFDLSPAFLRTADLYPAFTLATARAHDATLWTQDSHFEGIPGVQYRQAKQTV